MTPQQLVGTALRLAALWLVIVYFQLFGIVHALFKAAQSQASAVSLISICALPALALAFWLFPMLIAHQLLPLRARPDGASSALQESGAALAIIVGIYALMSALPTLGAGLMMVLFAPDPDFATAYFSSRGVEFLGQLSKFGVGLGLILLARPCAARIFPTHSHAA